MKSAKKTLTAKSEYKNKFATEKYDRVSVLLPKGTKESYKNYAMLYKGCSLNKLINDLLDDEINS